MNKKQVDGKQLKGLHFISIGGCSEVGMNLYAYIYNDQWILVDMGMGFDGNFGRELVVPSPSELVKNKSKIMALFLTHSHEDHSGSIPYLWPMIGCPIYARPFAIEMVRDKLSQFDLDSKVPLIKVVPNHEVKIGDFSVEFIQVAHSTPESSALAIKTPDGVVIHSGDWRIDDDPVLGSKTDEKRLRNYGEKGVLALVCDSTNVFKEQQFGAERDVRRNLIELVKKYPKNRILITCFASNLARLESCYLAAKESGRQLAIVGRSLKKIERIAKLAGYFSGIPAFLDEKKANALDSSKVLLVCTGSQGEDNSALTKISNDIHRSVRLRDEDVVIYSSRVIPGNEKAVTEIQDMLVGRGIKIITNIDCDIHASGHPSKEELLHLYDLLKPNSVVPIHGGKLHLYKHAEIAEEYGIKNVLVPHDGALVRLAGDCPEIIGEVKSGTLAVDGNKLLPLEGRVYKEREAVSCSGVVSVCLRCSKGSATLLEMVCLGVFEESEQVEIADVRSDIASGVQLSLSGGPNWKFDRYKVKSVVEKLVKSAFIEARGKKPSVIVHIVE
ncbi:MAG: ribonuclease J [Holosporaceae bacterium]|jgi:ribonuclease J|nr:ribonuclease J [Holosporaceae bacterium]